MEVLVVRIMYQIIQSRFIRFILEREEKKQVSDREYIERGALMEFAKKNIGGVIYQRDIDRIPAADVEPVVHSHWQWAISSEKGNGFICYVCGNWKSGGEELPIRCDACGAHMERSGSGDK